MITHFKVRNWERFQHYKNRNPPWIKLHYEILTSKDWVTLSDASRVLAVACMLLASRNNGIVPNDPEYIKRVAYLNTLPDFTELIDCKFLVDASKCLQVLADASVSVSVSEELDKEKVKEKGGTGGNNIAADLAREYWFLIPGMRKPIVDDLTPQFAEKLRVYGKDKADTIRKYIKSDTRDRTAPIWEFWKGCGLADPPKAAKAKEPHYPTPDEIEARAIRLAALPQYTAEQRKNMTQEELHADQQAYAAAYRGD